MCKRDSADTHTTTVADGSADEGRAMYIKYTGTLDSACTITIGPNTLKRVHMIENATSGSQNIIISQGSGANVTIGPGDTKVVYLDGAGSGAAVVDAFVDLDLSGGSVKLRIREVGQTTITQTITGTLADASNGKVTCAIPSGTWTTAGTFEGELEYTTSGGGIHTVQDLIKFKVRDDFD